MKNRFADMDCFVLAGGEQNPARDFETDGDLTRLEKGYRRYAALFERVTLVLKREQAVERYLNYPHVCDEETERDPMIGVRTALQRADSDPVFIGTSEIGDFPLELAVALVRDYNGELFLGYGERSKSGSPRPLFGVFSKRLINRIDAIGTGTGAFQELLAAEGRFVSPPDEISAQTLGLA
jgi:molybdopterin-guanine dinucleotide biosynthesis protein A